MGCPGEVAFLLALFVLLGTLHGTRAQYQDWVRAEYDDYDDGWVDEEDYEYGDLDIEDEEADQPEDSSGDSEDGDTEGIRPEAWKCPGANPRNQEFTPMCNNENCWIRVD